MTSLLPTLIHISLKKSSLLQNSCFCCFFLVAYPNMMTPAQLRNGTAIVYREEPYIVVSFAHSKQGRAGAVVRTKLKNLKSENVIEVSFQGSEKITPAELSRIRCQFLYKDESGAYFMDANYEQFSLSYEVVSESLPYLKDGQSIDVAFWEGKPVNVMLPPKVDLAVTEAPPAVKGDTATGASKTITLETGLEVLAPLFIKTGDTIRVNTETGAYVERV